MSISSTSRKAGPFTGDGATVTYPFAFKVFQASDVVVTRADLAGVETVLLLTTDYTVSLNVDQDNAPGGSITLLTALALNFKLVLTSNVPQLQQVVVTNGGGFFPAIFNAVFDRLTIFCQQLGERIGRQFTIPVTASGVTSFAVPVVPGAVLQWALDGSQLLAMALPDLSLQLALPPMAGQSGKFLTNNGAVASWGAVDLTLYTTKATTLTGGGLVTGGGDLSANRVFTVTGSTAADVKTGTSTSTAVTPAALMGSSAHGNLTDASTVAWNVRTDGYNTQLTLTATAHTMGAPTNLSDGQFVSVDVNSGAGGFTFLWNVIWDFGDLGVPPMPTGASKILMVTGKYNATTGKIRAGFSRPA